MAALLKNGGAARSMNCAVNASAAQERRVGRIDQSVNRLARDVADDKAHALLQECVRSLFSLSRF